MNLFSARHFHPAIADTRSAAAAAEHRAKLLDNCTITVALDRNLSKRQDIPGTRFVNLSFNC
jgi:hypothetical protein